MTAETHNHLMRITASFIISLVLWGGLGLMAEPVLKLRYVIGATLVTTLFLYAISAKAEADARRRDGNRN